MIALLALLYFDEYRGLASGIKFMGGPLASLLFPQVALLLEASYGYKGSLLIFGGISMHITAASILLKEPSWASEPNSGTQSEPLGTVDLQKSNESPRIHPKREVDAKGEKFWHAMCMFRSPYFYALLVSSVAMDNTVLMYQPNLVDFGLDRGFSTRQAQSVITYSSLGEICGFILLPLLSDRKCLSRRALYMGTFLLLGIAMFVHSLVEDYTAFVLSSTVVRASTGCLTTMKPVVVGDYFGAERLTAFWTISGLASLPLLLLTPSITGTYNTSRLHVRRKCDFE